VAVEAPTEEGLGLGNPIPHRSTEFAAGAALELGEMLEDLGLQDVAAVDLEIGRRSGGLGFSTRLVMWKESGPRLADATSRIGWSSRDRIPRPR